VTPTPSDQQRARRNFVFWLVLAATAGFLWVAWPVLLPVLWAAVLAVLFGPLTDRLAQELRGRRAAAAGLTLLIIIVLVILPLLLIGVAVIQQATGFYQALRSGAIDVQAPLAAINRALPPVREFLERLGLESQLRQGLGNVANAAAGWLAARAIGIGQNAVLLLMQSVIMLYILFFFLKDGRRILAQAQQVFPADDDLERRLLDRFASVTRAIIKGTFIVGVVQGALVAGAFAVLGIPAWLFWGVLATILSMLPAVGSTLIWAPAGIVLVLTGHVATGVILLLFGTFVISLIDNILRPKLVGRDTRMPDWIVFIAILGGVSSVGLSGVVVGPIVAGLFITAWEIFASVHGTTGAVPATAGEAISSSDRGSSPSGPAAAPTSG
jgi:predicted PurR-regulated permease PerM